MNFANFSWISKHQVLLPKFTTPKVLNGQTCKWFEWIALGKVYNRHDDWLKSIQQAITVVISRIFRFFRRDACSLGNETKFQASLTMFFEVDGNR